MLFRFDVGCPIVRHHITEVQAIAGDYAKEVAPIIEAHCRTCHQKGGVAPCAMDSHKQVAALGVFARIAFSTAFFRVTVFHPFVFHHGHGQGEIRL